MSHQLLSENAKELNFDKKLKKKKKRGGKDQERQTRLKGLCTFKISSPFFLETFCYARLSQMQTSFLQPFCF